MTSMQSTTILCELLSLGTASLLRVSVVASFGFSEYQRGYQKLGYQPSFKEPVPTASYLTRKALSLAFRVEILQVPLSDIMMYGRISLGLANRILGLLEVPSARARRRPLAKGSWALSSFALCSTSSSHFFYIIVVKIQIPGLHFKIYGLW